MHVPISVYTHICIYTLMNHVSYIKYRKVFVVRLSGVRHSTQHLLGPCRFRKEQPWMLLGTRSSAQSILWFGMGSLATDCWSVLARVSGEGDKP